MKNLFLSLFFIPSIIGLFLFLKKPDYISIQPSVIPLNSNPFEYREKYFATARVVVGPGEYTTIAMLNSRVYDFTQGKPILISGAPTNVAAVFGGCHHYTFLDANGNMWGADDNSVGELGIGNLIGQATPQKVLVDSLGNPFTNIIQLCPGQTAYDATGTGGFWNTFAVKADGTLWGCGNLLGGAEGNGTWGGGKVTRFVKIPFPAGVLIKKVQAGNVMVALSTTGDVYTWGGGNSFYNFTLGQGSSPKYFTPTKISLPAPAVDIAGGGLWNYAILNNGKIYGWGHENYLDYLGVPSGSAQNTPRDLTTLFNFPSTPKSVYINNECSYVLLTDSTIWAWGGNAVGTIGNGIELDYARYGGYPLPYGTSNPFPYNWDQGNHELMQIKPVQVAPGKHNFTDIFTSGALVYTCYAEDVNNNLYAWGRNKASICNGIVPGNSVSGKLQQYYPNSWDVPWITLIDPFGITNTTQVSSPYCTTHPTDQFGACNVFTIPNVSGPMASAGANQFVTGTTANLSGTVVSGSNTTIQYHTWKQISGPSTTIITLNSDLSPQVFNLVNGVYVFQMNATDANWKSDSSRVTITVGTAPPAPSTGGGFGKVPRGKKVRFVNK